MDTATSDAELAERLNRRRARMLPILGLFFIIQQIAYWSKPPAERMVDHVRMGAWAAMALVILLLVSTGGFWRRSAAVRAMINDEQTRANRNAAMSAGFIASMLTGIALYVFQAALKLSAGEAIHLIVSAGLIVLLIRFTMLERRGLD